MTNTESLFPPKSAAHPTIYAYSETRAELAGLLKVGYTDRAVETRMAEHYPTKLPDGTMPYRVELVESAMRALESIEGFRSLNKDIATIISNAKELKKAKAEDAKPTKNVQDFELLVGLNVFNGPLMNDAVFKFKRYEDGSISLLCHVAADYGKSA